MKEIRSLCSKRLEKEIEVKRGLHLAYLFFYFIAFNYLKYFSFKHLLQSVDWTALRTEVNYIPHNYSHIHLFIKECK